MAGGFIVGVDRHLPHQRCGDGRDGESVLRGYGFHERGNRCRHQNLRGHHDLGRRVSGRYFGAAHRRDAAADAGAVMSAATNLLYVWLAGVGHNVTALIFVISADNLASGIASSAFIGYLSNLANVNYSATQYALFSSMMLLLPKFIAGYSGEFVDAFGYGPFFTSTALLGVPVLFLVWFASKTKNRAN